MYLFKSIRYPSCIDIILTNSSKSFENATADCHKMVLTVLETTFSEVKPREILYRDYKKFNDINFKRDLKVAVSLQKKNQ